MTADIIFASPTLRISLAARDQPDILLTFDNWGGDKSGFSEPRAGQGFIDAGFAHMHLSTTANDWFLTRDLPEALDVMAERAAKYRRRSALSFSMGGDVAILASREIASIRCCFSRRKPVSAPRSPHMTTASRQPLPAASASMPRSSTGRLLPVMWWLSLIPTAGWTKRMPG